MDNDKLSTSSAMQTAKKTPVVKRADILVSKVRLLLLIGEHCNQEKLWLYYTNEGCFNGCGRDLIHQIDSDYSEAQENAGLESDASSAIWRQIETGDIHYHEEDAWDEQTYHVQQGAPADQHLQRETVAGIEHSLGDTYSITCYQKNVLSKQSKMAVSEGELHNKLKPSPHFLDLLNRSNFSFQK